jgi:hypothetical protein
VAAPSPERIIDALWRSLDADEERIYALLDAARDETIYPAVLGGDAEYFCLYIGELAPELAETAPYLVKLDPEAKFAAWLAKNGWGHGWGIFAQSRADMLSLRRHFRRFLMVYDDEEQPLYFRYYDPRVLRVFLPTCNQDELQTLFGPVDRYSFESEDGASLLRCSLSSSRLNEEMIKVTL